MKKGSLKRWFALLLAMTMVFSYTRVNRQVLADGEGGAAISESGEDSGSGYETTDEGTAGSEGEVNDGGAADSGEDGINDEDIADNTDKTEDKDEPDSEKETDDEETGGENTENGEDETEGDDEPDGENTPGGEDETEDEDTDKGLDESKDEGEPDDEGEADDGAATDGEKEAEDEDVTDGTGSDEESEPDGEIDTDELPELEQEATDEDISIDIQASLRQLLLESGTAFGSAYIDYVLAGFSHDMDFLREVYYSILPAPELAQEFLQQIYDLYGYMESEYESYNPESAYAFAASEHYALRTDTVANRLAGDSETVSDTYVAEFKKTVAKTDFRHYQVELSLTANPRLVTYTAMDIMLVFDVSKGSISAEARAAAKEFATQIFANTSGSTIGVIAYSGGSTVANNNIKYVGAATLDRYLEGLKGNNSGSNIQKALIQAKQGMGLLDDQTYTGERKKAIILIAANDRSKAFQNIWSDTWAVGAANVIDESIPISQGVYPKEGFKRWTYANQSNTTKYISGTDNNVFNVNDPASREAIAILEAQYIISQGIDIYSYAEEGAEDYYDILRQMTYKMTPRPNTLRGGNKHEDYAAGIRIEMLPDRSYRARDTSVLAFYEKVAAVLIQEMAGSIQVIDTLEENFEVLGENGEPIVIPEGASAAVRTDLKVALSDDGKNQILIWSVGPVKENEAKLIDFKVRVKDIRVWEEGRGSRYGNAPIGLSTETKVMYSADDNPGRSLTVGQPLAEVDPLIAGCAGILDEDGNKPPAVLAGSITKLTGYITGGNGNYSYRWYSREAGGNWAAIEGYTGAYRDDVSGNALSIPLNQFDIPDTKAGSYEYLLAITDKTAAAAGYKYTADLTPMESVIQANYQCNLQIVEPQLTVKVIGGAGNPQGKFETRVSEIMGSDIDRQWYFMGMDMKTYGYADGIRGGRYSYFVETYVPYGYSVSVSNPEEPAVIKLEEGAEGKWECNHPVITITVTKEDPYYFYDWDWPDLNIQTPLNSDILMLPVAFIPGLFIKRKGRGKGWFK